MLPLGDGDFAFFLLKSLEHKYFIRHLTRPYSTYILLCNPFSVGVYCTYVCNCSSRWCCSIQMIVWTSWDCCDGWHKGLHFCPRDVGRENSLITLKRLDPGNALLNLSINGEFKCIGALGAITYLFVEQTGNITVALAQYTRWAVSSKT